eukprot:11028678-Alexandrium_andersonii.AAC.1
MLRRMRVHAVDGAAAQTVIAIHISKQADEACGLISWQVPLAAEGGSALAAKVGSASAGKSRVGREQLIL